MADVYIESMEDDITMLKESLPLQSDKITSTLAIVHKIKGGAMQIGLSSISQTAVFTENLGKLGSAQYPKALSELVNGVEQSIADVTYWKNSNTN